MTHFWVPRTKIIESRDEILAPINKISGRFKIEGRLDDGRTRLIADWQSNLVTDYGLNAWGSAGVVSYCSVGTSTIAADVGDTSLKAWVASTAATSTSFGAQSSAPWYGWRIFTATFSPPGTEHIIGEVGLGTDHTGGLDLFTRARVKDAGGGETTFTWLSNETLIITYELRNYPFLDDYTPQTVISGVTYDLTIRCANANAYNSWSAYFTNRVALFVGCNAAVHNPAAYSDTIRPINTGPGGLVSLTTVRSAVEYSQHSLKRTGTATWGPTLANYTDGIKAVLISSNVGDYQVAFANLSNIGKGILKTNTDTLTLNFSSMVWGRY